MGAWVTLLLLSLLSSPQPSSCASRNRRGAADVPDSHIPAKMGSFFSHGTSFVVSMLGHGDIDDNDDEEEATVEDAEDEEALAKPAVVDGVTPQREGSTRPAGPRGGGSNPGGDEEIERNPREIQQHSPLPPSQREYPAPNRQQAFSTSRPFVPGGYPVNSYDPSHFRRFFPHSQRLNFNWWRPMDVNAVFSNLRFRPSPPPTRNPVPAPAPPTPVRDLSTSREPLIPNRAIFPNQFVASAPNKGS